MRAKQWSDNACFHLATLRDMITFITVVTQMIHRYMFDLLISLALDINKLMTINTLKLNRNKLEFSFLNWP